MRNHLGIGSRLKHIAFLLEHLLEDLVVLNHAVVNNGDDLVTAHVRVRVFLGCCTMRRPTRMPNACAALHRRLIDPLRQIIDATHRAMELEPG